MGIEVKILAMEELRVYMILIWMLASSIDMIVSSIAKVTTLALEEDNSHLIWHMIVVSIGMHCALLLRWQPLLWRRTARAFVSIRSLRKTRYKTVFVNLDRWLMILIIVDHNDQERFVFKDDNFELVADALQRHNGGVGRRSRRPRSSHHDLSG